MYEFGSSESVCARLRKCYIYMYMIKSMNHNSLSCKEQIQTCRPLCIKNLIANCAAHASNARPHQLRQGVRERAYYNFQKYWSYMYLHVDGGINHNDAYEVHVILPLSFLLRFSPAIPRRYSVRRSRWPPALLSHHPPNGSSTQVQVQGVLHG